MTRAFDDVNHSTLLRKMECYGIRGNALNLMKSYLVDRMQITELAGTVSAGFGPSPITFTSPSTSERAQLEERISNLQLVLPVALRPLEQTQAAAEADISGESAEDPDEAAPDDEPDDVTESLITAPQITASAAAEAGRYAAREVLQALHDLHPPVKTIQDAAAAQLLKRLCGRKREALTAEAARLCERFDALSGSSVQEKEDKEEVKPSEVKPQPIQDPSVCLPTTTTTTTTQCPICALFHAHAASHTHQHATDKGVQLDEKFEGPQLDKKYNAALFWNSSVATESLTQHTTTECPCKARAREQALKQLQALQQQKALQLKEQQQSLQQALQQQQPLQQALQGVMQQALQPSGQSLTRSLMLLSNLLQNFQKEQNVPKPQPTPPPSPTTLKPMKPSSPPLPPQPPQSPQPLQPPQAPPKPSQKEWPPQLLPLLPMAKSALRSSSLMLLLSPDGARRVAW